MIAEEQNSNICTGGAYILLATTCIMHLLRRKVMGIFSRLMNFLRIRTSSMLDKAEEPGQVMDYSYNKQLEQLQQLRRSITDVVTNEKRLELQQSQLLE